MGIKLLVLSLQLLLPLPLMAESVILDNGASAFETSGPWESINGPSSSSYYGHNFHLSKQKYSSASWQLAASAGDYELSIIYPSHARHSRRAIYTVHHKEGESTFIMDQTKGGGEWFTLGTFSDPTEVSVYSDDNRFLVADAVKMEPLSTSTPDEPESDDSTPSCEQTSSGSGGAFFSRKAYFNGANSYTAPTSNFLCNTRIFISNITTEPIDVTLLAYDSSGNLILDDDLADKGRLRLESKIPTTYSDAGPVKFRLAPKQTVVFYLMHGEPATVDFEQGEIQWEPVEEKGQKYALLVNGSARCDEPGPGTKMSWRAIPINAGLPF